MKIPEYAIKIILLVALLCAAGARFSSTRSSRYPYFPGESAMNYRDAMIVASGKGMGVLDRHTNKSNWPEGYRPARVRPVGVEYFAGAVIATARWLGGEETRATARRLVVLFFSLCAIAMYGLARNLWGSQSAGLMAAAMVALFPPLVGATNGKEIGHTTFALVLVTFHLLCLQAFGRRPRAPRAPDTPGRERWILPTVGTALFAFALMAAWSLAPYYIAACSLVATLFYPLPRRRRQVLAVTHLAAFLAGALVFAYPAASRIAFTWPGALLAACCAEAFLPERFGGVKRGATFVAAATVVLTLAFLPLRSGASGVGLPGIEYAGYRLRFLFARPVSPSLLPAEIRDLWSSDHAQPSAHALIAFFLPFLFFVPVAVAEARRLLRESRSNGDTDAPAPGHTGGALRARILTAAAAAALGAGAYAVDRSALALAVVAMLPFAALAGRALAGPSSTRLAATLVGGLIVAGQLFWPDGGANAASQISRALGVAHRDESKVLWISMENTDEELVRFVAVRTSTKDPFLGLPRATAVLLAFSGRTSVLLEGGYARNLSAKRVELTRLLYGGEDELFRRCRDAHIHYVLYSIDYLLDRTRYAPAYLAGLSVIPQQCVAVSMQFEPEALTHFNLVYENDRYRLFRVTDHLEPVFLTDHPPVYQKSIFKSSGGDYTAFRERIGRLLLVYTEAKEMAAAGLVDAAIGRLMWCLNEAPRFTAARIALGATLLQDDQPERAKHVLMSVIQYAPDNPNALYLAADASFRLGEYGEALSLLKILRGTTNDSDILGRAKLLRSLIESEAARPDSSGAESPR